MKKSDATEELQPRQIVLLEEKSAMTHEELCAAFPGRSVFACDFYVSGIEKEEEISGGYRKGKLYNIDHHAPTPRMCRPVSSVNLAEEFFLAGGTVPPDTVVVIHHTDADSILSSALMAGALPLEPWIVQAGFRADHTGEEDGVSDLLQGLEGARSVEFSLRNLKKLRAGEALHPAAGVLLKKRRQARLNARACVARFKQRGAFFSAVLEEKIDSVFWPSLLPEASVIMTACPSEYPSRWHVKVRLGQKVPTGLFLNKLGLPDFGARWNAGSSERHGDTAIPPEEYANIVWKKIQPFL